MSKLPQPSKAFVDAVSNLLPGQRMTYVTPAEHRYVEALMQQNQTYVPTQDKVGIDNTRVRGVYVRYVNRISEHAVRVLDDLSDGGSIFKVFKPR